MIAAEGEHKASSALKDAAHVIAESPHALQVSSQLTHANDIPDHVIVIAEVSPDTQLNISRTQLNHHLPNAYQYCELLSENKKKLYKCNKKQINK